MRGVATRLLITTFVMMICVNAYAQGGNTLAVTLAYPPYLNVFYERTGWEFLGFEVAAGAELVLDSDGDQVFSLSPFVVLAYYPNDRTSVVLEIFVPQGIVPAIGQPGRTLSLTTAYRW